MKISNSGLMIYALNTNSGLIMSAGQKQYVRSRLKSLISHLNTETVRRNWFRMSTEQFLEKRICFCRRQPE